MLQPWCRYRTERAQGQENEYDLVGSVDSNVPANCMRCLRRFPVHISVLIYGTMRSSYRSIFKLDDCNLTGAREAALRGACND